MYSLSYFTYVNNERHLFFKKTKLDCVKIKLSCLTWHFFNGIFYNLLATKKQKNKKSKNGKKFRYSHCTVLFYSFIHLHKSMFNALQKISF